MQRQHAITTECFGKKAPIASCRQLVVSQPQGEGVHRGPNILRLFRSKAHVSLHPAKRQSQSLSSNTPRRIRKVTTKNSNLTWNTFKISQSQLRQLLAKQILQRVKKQVQADARSISLKTIATWQRNQSWTERAQRNLEKNELKTARASEKALLCQHIEADNLEVG